jgi:hypothetical protein
MPSDAKENVSPEQVAAFSKGVATAIRTEQKNISFKDAETFLAGSGDHNFAHGFHVEANPEGGQPIPVGFIKVCHENNRLQLAREALTANLAGELELPVISCLTPLTLLDNGDSLIELAVLNLENGDLLSNKELIAAVDPVFGTRAAQTILSLYQKEIPTGIDTSVLKRDDERSHSLKTFQKIWQEQNGIVFDPQNQELVDELIGSNALKEIVDSTFADIRPLLEESENPNIEYLVHDDASPNNMFFNKDGSVTILDWEYAGATHNFLLASITDLGNFYGRCWPNPEMQRNILSTILTFDKFDSLETKYKVAKTVAVFGSMYLSKYAMKRDNGEHPMPRALLGNLLENLDYLSSEYRSLSQT